MRRRKVVKGVTDFVEGTCLDKDMFGNRQNIEEDLIAALRGRDIIRKHLAECAMNERGLEENTIHTDFYMDLRRK